MAGVLREDVGRRLVNLVAYVQLELFVGLQGHVGMLVGVFALDRADLLVDAIVRVSHNLRLVLDDLPSVVLRLLIHVLYFVDQELIMVTLCLVQLLHPSVCDWVEIVSADNVTVDRIVADAARKALIEVATRVGQVRVHDLEPSHVDVVPLLLGRVQFELDFEAHITSQLLNCGVGRCQPEAGRVVLCAAFGDDFYSLGEVARPDVLQALVNLV